jgi:hypothetical protein
MANRNNPCSLINQILDGWNRGFNASIIAYKTVFHWDIKVTSKDDGFAR